MREAIIVTRESDGSKISVSINNIEIIKEECSGSNRSTYIFLKHPTNGYPPYSPSFSVKEPISEVISRINETCRGRSFGFGEPIHLPPNLKFHKDNEFDYSDYDSIVNGNTNDKLESIESSLSMIAVSSTVLVIGVIIMFLIKVLS